MFTSIQVQQTELSLEELNQVKIVCVYSTCMEEPPDHDYVVNAERVEVESFYCGMWVGKSQQFLTPIVKI